jgi:outer membrane protein OmpA-like peptidoglycan-associated protein
LKPVGGPIQIAVIQFGAGSSSLDGGDLAVLQDVARMYKRSGGVIRVFAHASSDARMAAGNLDVSERRGANVVNTLLRLGVPADAITMEALSDGNPIYTTATAMGVAANRRAEIFLDF